MKKKLTITVDEEVYEGLHRVIGRRNISGFLERLARPHVVLAELDEAYAAMASDAKPGNGSSGMGRGYLRRHRGRRGTMR
jgi:predicted CopG family antitoxin